MGSSTGSTVDNHLGTVSFIAMADGTVEDYALLDRYERLMTDELATRLLDAVAALDASIGGYQVTRKEHSLQSATRAQRDGRDEEYVAAALLHDIGDVLAPHTHGEMVAAILRPYVREELCWVVQHHGVFQQHYYGRQTGVDPDARDRYREHLHYDACVEFCERYDQNCFDPAYDAESLEHFAPLVARVFAQPSYLAAERV